MRKTFEVEYIGLPNDGQVGGTHFLLPIQPIDFIIANNIGFCEGNIIKYISRYKNKNGVEDLYKARQYIEFLITEEERKNANIR